MKNSKKRGRKIWILIVVIIIAILITLCLLFYPKNNLTNNPKDTDIKNVLKKLDGAYSFCMATEDNDPNGNLNKQGGYTGAVYFRLKQVDDKIKKDDIKDYGEEFVNSDDWSNRYDEYDNSCEAGTSSGGQIEIYPNESDAKKRDKYLSGLDGFLSGGYHTVEGTLVIRVSDELTSSQQKKIANEIIELLNK